MGQIYNIPLSDCILKEVSSLIKQRATDYKIILPNRRSCRELKKHLLDQIGNESFFLPEISSISDYLSFEDERMTFLILELLKNKKIHISINVLYDLAKNLCSFVQDLILNNADYTFLSQSVPTHLQEYWNHTLAILNEIFQSKKILKFIEIFKVKQYAFIASIKKQRIMAVCIGEANYYTKLLFKNVMSSKEGIVVITGLENQNFRNYEINKRQIGQAISEVTKLPSYNVTNKLEMMEFYSTSAEAFAIAVAIRKAYFEKQNVLVVSPDQNLTVKIKSELLRWNIFADDSKGYKASNTKEGMLVSLVLEMLCNHFNTVDVINVFKAIDEYRYVSLELESFFRNMQIVPNIFFEAVQIWPEKHTYPAFMEMINKIQQMEFYDTYEVFSKWIEKISEIISLISFGCLEIFLSVSKFFLQYSSCLPKMNFHEFSIFFKNHILSTEIRNSKGYTSGIIILGIIEAQLLDADLVIIAGANESAWSASNISDFWISQSMLKSLNIQDIEVKNDFLQCIFERLTHKKNVLITRSKIVDGIQQQKYGYLEKIEEATKIHEATWLMKILFDFKKNPKREILTFESPSPSLHIRPQKIWVSDIDLLLNNPYAFYAKKILMLKEDNHINDLKNIKGNYIHKVLDEFVKNATNKKDINCLKKIAKKTLLNNWLTEIDFNLWFFRINKIFSFIVKNMDNNCRSLSEIRGSFMLEISKDYFINVCCKADRIDISPSGMISIIDYKTGSIPTKTQVEKGNKVQLPVEALIAQNGGFKGINSEHIESLEFWKLSGASNGCDVITIANTIEKTNFLIGQTLHKLKSVLCQYNVLGSSYGVNVYSKYEESYMHLARVKEWHDAE